MLDANPHRPELTALVDDGVDVEVIVATAIELRRARRSPPNVGYLVGTVRGRARDAQAQWGGTGSAASGGARESVCELNERLAAAAFDREGVFDGRP